MPARMGPSSFRSRVNDTMAWAILRAQYQPEAGGHAIRGGRVDGIEQGAGLLGIDSGLLAVLQVGVPHLECLLVDDKDPYLKETY
jgi:hypothetical protein